MDEMRLDGFELEYIVSPMESKFILAIRKLNGAVHVLKDLKFETEVWVLAGGIFAVSSKYSRERNEGVPSESLKNY